MRFTLEGINPFMNGWLARFCGMGNDVPASMNDAERFAFTEGWATCDETPDDGYPNRLTAFEGCIKNGDIRATLGE